MKQKNYCTCLGGKNNFTKFYEVETNKDGECKECGYYSVTQLYTPNVHGNISKINKEVILSYMSKYNNNFKEVSKILNIETQQVKHILGPKLTKKIVKSNIINLT